MERTTSRFSTVEISSAIVNKEADGSNIFHQHARAVDLFLDSPQLPWWSCSGDATLTAAHRNSVEKPSCQRGHAHSVLSSPGGLVSGHCSGSGLGDNSYSIHGHATSQSLPASFFPMLGTVDVQALVANSFPATHGGQPLQGLAPPLFSSLVSTPSSGFESAGVGYDYSHSIHGHVTSSLSVPSSFSCTLGMVDPQEPFPASLGDLPWQGLAAAPQPSWTEQIVAWPQSEMSFFSPAAVVSGQPPLASSTDNCVGFAQPSSNCELPPLPPSLRIPPLEEGSTLSTIGGTMPWHYAADSSMGAGSSIPGVPNLSAAGGMKMKAPMPPLEEASTYSSMGAGSSIPAVPNLTAGGKKMKAPMSPPPSRGVGAGSGGSSNLLGFAAQPSMKSELAALRAGLEAHLLPVKQEPAICKKEADELDQDAIQHPMPDNSTGHDDLSSWGWDAALKMPVVESSRYNGGSSSITKVAGSTPAGHNSNSTLKLLPPLPPPTVRAGASSSQGHVVAGIIFTDAEKDIIRKDKGLQKLLNTDPKKAKSKVSSRLSAARRKAIRDKHILELECKLETLEWRRETWSAKLQLMQEKHAELETYNKEICMMVQELEQQSTLKDAVTETQKAQIQNLKNIIELNMQRNN